MIHSMKIITELGKYEILRMYMLDWVNIFIASISLRTKRRQLMYRHEIRVIIQTKYDSTSYTCYMTDH